MYSNLYQNIFLSLKKKMKSRKSVKILEKCENLPNTSRFCLAFPATLILSPAICGVGILFKGAFQICVVIYTNYISFPWKKRCIVIINMYSHLYQLYFFPWKKNDEIEKIGENFGKGRKSSKHFPFFAWHFQPL